MNATTCPLDVLRLLSAGSDREGVKHLRAKRRAPLPNPPLQAGKGVDSGRLSWHAMPNFDVRGLPLPLQAGGGWEGVTRLRERRKSPLSNVPLQAGKETDGLGDGAC